MARHRTAMDEAAAAVAVARGCVGFGVWSVLNRQAARRAIDANRRHWGDL